MKQDARCESACLVCGVSILLRLTASEDGMRNKKLNSHVE